MSLKREREGQEDEGGKRVREDVVLLDDVRADAGEVVIVYGSVHPRVLEMHLCKLIINNSETEALEMLRTP